MCGSATLAIVESSTCMIVASITIPVSIRRVNGLTGKAGTSRSISGGLAGL